MISKNTVKSNIAAIREEFRHNLDKVNEQLDGQDKMRIALELKISLSTVERYVAGDISEIRKLELAESILSTAREVLRLKNLAPVTP